MLILFDIDATLLVTMRAGVRAMEEAGRVLHGPEFTFAGVEFAGRLDPLILRDLLSRNGVDPTAEAVGRMKAEYVRRLPGWLSRPGATRALPGVHALLDALEARGGVTLGVLTGNFEASGMMKLRAAGLDPERFAVRVWGDESPRGAEASRRDLPPVGLARYRARTGREASGAVIVGDAPHDVDCARAHGLRSLGVATGLHGEEELSAAGASRVVRDLSDTPEIVRFLLREA